MFMHIILQIKKYKILQKKPYLDEVSLKFPPSSNRTLANKTALTNGTAVKSSRQRLTVNLYLFFFTMNDILTLYMRNNVSKTNTIRTITHFI